MTKTDLCFYISFILNYVLPVPVNDFIDKFLYANISFLATPSETYLSLNRINDVV